MKNKWFLTYLFIFLFTTDFTYSQLDGFPGDLRILSDATSGTCTATMEIVSMPYEGIAESSKTFHQYNRIGEIYNGISHRIYQNGGSLFKAYPLYYKQGTLSMPSVGAVLSLGHCSVGELPDSSIANGAWGFAKYKITIYISSTNETYICYFNCLDSDYGKKYYEGRNIYGLDWTFQYIPALPLNHRLIFKGADNNLGEIYFDTLTTYEIPEYKMWELIYPNKPNPGEP